VWNYQIAKEFAVNQLSHPNQDVVFICGRYEGIDERFLKLYVDEIYSIGDYVLSGGEIAVMTLLDSSLRFVPGILGNKFSASDDSFEQKHLIESPRYTRPQDFHGMVVPEILLSGHHQKMMEYELKEKIEMTKKFRPDLWKKHLENK
jgi:tRNA (guanine37-N1)-methyltransferase